MADPDEEERRIQAIIDRILGGNSSDVSAPLPEPPIGASPELPAGFYPQPREFYNPDQPKPGAGEPPRGVFTQADLDALEATHRGIKGKKVIDPTIRTYVLGRPQDIRNPNPQVRYIFGDGTHITLKQHEAGRDYTVTDPGTALKPPTSQKPDYYTPSTSGPKILVTRADGTEEWIDNPNYQPPKGTSPYSSDFTKGNRLYRYNTEGIPESVFTFPEEEEEQEPTPYQKWTMGPEWDYKRQQDELKRQQLEQQAYFARQQQAWKEASDMIQTQAQMAPYALRPGQEYHTNWGPGEIRAELSRKLKMPYNPESYRVSPVNLDWEQAWQEAMRRYGGQ